MSLDTLTARFCLPGRTPVVLVQARGRRPSGVGSGCRLTWAVREINELSEDVGVSLKGVLAARGTPIEPLLRRSEALRDIHQGAG